jgi:SOS response regulatory protein OraA/RecX
MFIPYGMPTMEAQEHYKKAIIKNNDKQNAVQGLAVRGFSQELFQ